MPKFLYKEFFELGLIDVVQTSLSNLINNEDYFFWVLEIDGERKDNPDRPTIVPILETRGPKKFVKYPLGVAGLVNGQNIDSVPIRSLDTLGWIMNSQIHFNRVLKDLKKRNYEVQQRNDKILNWGG